MEKNIDQFKNSNFIYPQLKSEWEEHIQNEFFAFIENTHEVIEALNTGKTFDEVYKILETQENTQIGFNFCIGNVIYYSKKQGPEFGEWVAKNKKPEFNTPENIKYLAEISERNVKFDTELAETKTK